MICYTESLDGIEPQDLDGFFVGWPSRPSAETHLRLLNGSDHAILAIDETTGRVVGFVTAVSDGVLSAYIPLLEVLPAYQHRGIGTDLVRRMLAKLDHLYMIDVICDADLILFYRRFAMQPANGMMIRNYARRAG